MHTVAVFRGISFATGSRVQEIDCPIVPRIGETISLPQGGKTIPEKVREVNYLVDHEEVRIRVLLAPKLAR